VFASVNLPCTIKLCSSLLALAHPDGPWKRDVKLLWWWLLWQLVANVFCTLWCMLLQFCLLAWWECRLMTWLLDRSAWAVDESSSLVMFSCCVLCWLSLKLKWISLSSFQLIDCVLIQNHVCHCLRFLKVQPPAVESACWNSGWCLFLVYIGYFIVRDADPCMEVFPNDAFRRLCYRSWRDCGQLLPVWLCSCLRFLHNVIIFVIIMQAFLLRLLQTGHNCMPQLSRRWEKNCQFR